ncbi:4-alpha-glucanotransferase [uncultured archaeon]|nr:4-alpha-glucanotransferase [uncultured archaeon]
MKESWLTKRQSGALLHITANPGSDAVGTINNTYRVADLLKKSGQTVLQRLPFGPTSVGDSPFQGPSLLAGNPNLISLEALVKLGDLSASDYGDYLTKWQRFKSENSGRSQRYCEYGFLWEHKLGIGSTPGDFTNSVLRKSFLGFKHNKDENRLSESEIFYQSQKNWLDDYSLFMTLKQKYGFSKVWSDWNDTDKFRKQGFGSEINSDEIEFHKYLQFVFDEQMSALSKYLNSIEITTIGDIPIYPAYDSCDVWQNPEIYQLDELLNMTYVAAVPPDYFSPEDGQLWGNPVYKFKPIGSEKLQEKIFSSFSLRINRALRYNDIVKRDHSRAFTAYGRTSATEKTAKNAEWTPGPGNSFLDYLENYLGYRPKILDENLGIITPDVKTNLENSGNPGMQVLVFADPNDKKNEHLIENSKPNCAIYTGTQDNEPVLENISSRNENSKQGFLKYLSEHSQEKEVNFQAIDTISSSKANLAIYQMQDALGFGEGSRTNFPGRLGFWKWRMTLEDLDRFEEVVGPKLLEITMRNARY